MECDINVNDAVQNDLLKSNLSCDIIEESTISASSPKDPPIETDSILTLKDVFVPENEHKTGENDTSAIEVKNSKILAQDVVSKIFDNEIGTLNVLDHLKDLGGEKHIS